MREFIKRTDVELTEHLNKFVPTNAIIIRANYHNTHIVFDILIYNIKEDEVYSIGIQLGYEEKRKEYTKKCIFEIQKFVSEILMLMIGDDLVNVNQKSRLTLDDQVNAMESALKACNNIAQKVQLLGMAYDDDPDFTKEATDIVRANISKQIKIGEI